jgi:hypothetical protein
MKYFIASLQIVKQEECQTIWAFLSKNGQISDSKVDLSINCFQRLCELTSAWAVHLQTALSRIEVLNPF